MPSGIRPVNTMLNQLMMDMELATLPRALAITRCGMARSQLTRGRQFWVSHGESRCMSAVGTVA